MKGMVRRLGLPLLESPHGEAMLKHFHIIELSSSSWCISDGYHDHQMPRSYTHKFYVSIMPPLLSNNEGDQRRSTGFLDMRNRPSPPFMLRSVTLRPLPRHIPCQRSRLFPQSHHLMKPQ